MTDARMIEEPRVVEYPNTQTERRSENRESKEQDALLLSDSVYVPPGVVDDGAVPGFNSVSVTVDPHHTWNSEVKVEGNESDRSPSGLDIPPLSVLIYTLLELQPVEVGQKLGDAPTIEFGRQKEQRSSEENLLASSYIPPGSVGGDVARQIDDTLTIEAAQADPEYPHNNNRNETSDESARVDRPVTEASDTPGSAFHAATEHPVELKNRVYAEQELDATTDGSGQVGDEYQPKPIQKRRNFMGRLLDRADGTKRHRNGRC